MRTGGGFGGIALAHLLKSQSLLAAPRTALPGGLPHHPAKATRVIQLFMNGGVSQMDTFDCKPALDRSIGSIDSRAHKPGRG